MKIHVILLIMTSFLLAQAPVTDWFTAHGTNSEEHVHEGMQTSDGGYIAIGHGIESSDDDDMLIIKVDQDGLFEWKQEFGTANKKGAGYCIAEVSGGYIAGGAIFDPDSQRTQRFLAKIDLAGNIAWEKFYSSAGVGGIRGIDIIANGGIVATGYMNTPNISEFQGFVFIVDEGDGFIMKLDAHGLVEWEKSIDAPQGTKVRAISEGYAVCSTVWSWNPQTGDHQDYCLIKTDQNGNTIWRNLYGGDEADHLYDFDVTQDGGYVLGGHTKSYGVANWDYLLMKIDSDGNEQWHQTFGQPRGYDELYIHDEAYGVRQTPEGGYILAGGSGDEYSYSASGHPAGPSDEWKIFLVRTDGNGHKLWEAVYPPVSVGNNAGEYVGLTNEGGFIVFVDTDSQTPPNPNNFGFLKTMPDTGITALNSNAPVGNRFELFQNYPNPFNPSTTIEFALPKSGFVTLTVYNIVGEKVATLVSENLTAGSYQYQWETRGLAGGVYFYRIEAANFTKTRKMLLIR